MKSTFLKLLIVLLSMTAPCKKANSQKIRFGASIGYDFNINTPLNSRYKLSESSKDGKAGLGTFNVFLKVPLKNGLSVYPTFQGTLLESYQLIEDLNGDFMPEGYVVSKPYKTVGNGWSARHYSHRYNYFLSDGSVSKMSIGANVTKELGEGIEIGVGLFYNIINLEVENFKAYDEYWWSGSTGTTYDHYTYSDTNVDTSPYLTQTISDSFLSVPVSIMTTLDFGIYTVHGGISAHLSSNIYFGFQTGVMF